MRGMIRESVAQLILCDPGPPGQSKYRGKDQGTGKCAQLIQCLLQTKSLTDAHLMFRNGGQDRILTGLRRAFPIRSRRIRTIRRFQFWVKPMSGTAISKPSVHSPEILRRRIPAPPSPR